MSKTPQEYSRTRVYGKHVITGVPYETEVDASGSLILITHQHSKVHQGVYYNASYYFSTVSDGDSAFLLLKLSASYENHTVIQINTGGDGRLNLYENPVLAGDGTSINVINHNRSSSNTSSTTAFHTPSFNSPPDYGTALIPGTVLPGGTKNKGGGAIASAAGEQWVWAASNNYLIEVINLSGGNQDISIDAAFYEVPV